MLRENVKVDEYWFDGNSLDDGFSVYLFEDEEEEIVLLLFKDSLIILKFNMRKFSVKKLLCEERLCEIWIVNL